MDEQKRKKISIIGSFLFHIFIFLFISITGLLKFTTLPQYDEIVEITSVSGSGGGVLRGDVALAVNAGVEIEEIENGRLHGVDERLAVKAVFRIGDALFEQVEIAAADDLLLRRKVHHGIEKQCQRAFHAVVALRRAQIYEIGRASCRERV